MRHQWSLAELFSYMNFVPCGGHMCRENFFHSQLQLRLNNASPPYTRTKNNRALLLLSFELCYTSIKGCGCHCATLERVSRTSLLSQSGTTTHMCPSRNFAPVIEPLISSTCAPLTQLLVCDRFQEQLHISSTSAAGGACTISWNLAGYILTLPKLLDVKCNSC